MNSPSIPSGPSSIRPGSDVPWLIARACAGEWPFSPKWLDTLRHPAVAKQYRREMRMFVIPDLGDRWVQIGVEIVRREARRVLGNREVKHFQVLCSRQQDFRAERHRSCDGDGCDGCRGLGVTFVVDKGEYVDLMGWVAVVHVAQ